MTNFLELFDRPIAFHRCLVDVAGSVDGAVFLSQAIYWQRRSKDKFWWKTSVEWQEETGIKRDRQLKIRKQLSKNGVLLSKLKGLPAKVYYFVDQEKLRKSLNLPVIANSDNCMTPGASTRQRQERQQDVAPSDSILIRTETTAETTNTQGACTQAQPKKCTRFDEFWQAYPTKRNKKRSRDIWQRKKLDKLADMIIADVTRRRIDDTQWADGFIPHATTYLNGHRWEDEIITKRCSNYEINRKNSNRQVSGAGQETRGEMHARVNRELYETAAECEMDGSAYREAEDPLQRAFHESDWEDRNGCQSDAQGMVASAVRLHR